MLNQLVKHTSVSTRFSANMVALVGAQPRTLNLKEFLQHFLDFRWAVAFGVCYGCTCPGLVALLAAARRAFDVFEQKGVDQRPPWAPYPPTPTPFPPRLPSFLAGARWWSGGRGTSWGAPSSACTWLTASWRPWRTWTPWCR